MTTTTPTKSAPRLRPCRRTNRGGWRAGAAWPELFMFAFVAVMPLAVVSVPIMDLSRTSPCAGLARRLPDDLGLG